MQAAGESSLGHVITGAASNHERLEGEKGVSHLHLHFLQDGVLSVLSI